MAVAFVFPGQGSQCVGMGHDLYQHFPVVREVFAQAEAAVNINLTHLCFTGPEAALTATEHAQPAILTVSVALLRALELLSNGRISRLPRLVAGHSLGEYAALVAGGSLDFATAIRLVRRRGELMAAASTGTMAAVLGLEAATIEAICQEVSLSATDGDAGTMQVVVANYNIPGQWVISGTTTGVKRASMLARERGARRVQPLKVSAAFHSPLMGPVALQLAEVIATAPVADLAVPLVTNVTAQPIRTRDAVRRELVAQVTAPVRWIAAVQWMVAQGIETFVEIGPGNVLTGLIKRIAPAVTLINVSNLANLSEGVRWLCAMYQDQVWDVPAPDVWACKGESWQ